MMARQYEFRCSSPCTSRNSYCLASSIVIFDRGVVNPSRGGRCGGGRRDPGPAGNEGARREDGDHRVGSPARRRGAPDAGIGAETALRHGGNGEGRRDRGPGRPPGDDRGGTVTPRLHREAGGRLASRERTFFPSATVSPGWRITVSPSFSPESRWAASPFRRPIATGRAFARPFSTT